METALQKDFNTVILMDDDNEDTIYVLNFKGRHVLNQLMNFLVSFSGPWL
jgi:hypothetical protein